MSIRRRRYFINPKVQLKYIMMSIMPALIMVLLTTYFLVKSTEIKLYRQKEAALIGMSSLDLPLAQLRKVKDEAEISKNFEDAQKALLNLQAVMERKQVRDLKELSKSRNLIILALIAMLIMVGALALIYSHRIVGPLSRLKSCIDMLTDGKEVPPIRLRRDDEFKDLALSLEKLRKKLSRENN